MKVHVNGECREVPDGSCLEDLLEHLELRASRIAVELNREIVPRTRFSEQTLRDGDRLEIVTFVGGG
ncbi:MAG: sulfur carrier protein ThiS [Planctomycetota bacterium]